MKSKSSPNLPASSRMQMPSGGTKTSKMVKETAGMKGGKGTTKKVMTAAKKKSVKPKY